jgi:hypothetical protein
LSAFKKLKAYIQTASFFLLPAGYLTYCSKSLKYNVRRRKAVSAFMKEAVYKEIIKSRFMAGAAKAIY